VIARLVRWCAGHPRLVIAVALIAALGGESARRRLAGDVVPDLADPQIGIVADWMGHPAPEVAEAVTKVLTLALGDLPGTKAVRGTTMNGMAYVDVVLNSASHVDAARAALAARVEGARPRLPPGVRLYVGPPASSTGWVLEYALTDPALVSSQLELRRFQQDVLRPALSAIPGVAEVATVGGDVREIRVDVRPRELRARGLAFTDVADTLRAVFDARGGVARLSTAELEALPVRGGPGGALVRDVALVRQTEDMPTGMADVAGLRAVGGIVIARRDANLSALAEAVKQVIAREALRLPHRAADPEREDSGAAADVHVKIMYDRSELAGRVRHTLLRALAEEVGVVVLVILLFLLHPRSALVPLLTLPVVVLLTLGAMWLLGVPATIMSLGGIGIALGMAVDADIVALEASHRQLEAAGPGAPAEARRDRILAASRSFAPAILTSLVIAALSFLPVFAFTGETGRLLRPLALTKTLVILSAGLVTLTLAPALRDLLLRGPGAARLVPELDNPLTRTLVRAYRPFVHFALARPALTLATAALALVSVVPVVGRLGGEFLPRVDEGDLLYMPTTLPGAPPTETAVQLFWQDRAMSQLPEVETVFGKIGRADSGTDPAPYSMAETTLRLRPRSEWPRVVARPRWYSKWAPPWLQRLLRLGWPDRRARTTPELVDELDRAVRLPGWTAAWTGPARARMDMMATGVRTPVGLRIVSPDVARLDALGTALRQVVDRLPGTRSAVFESLGGETWLDFAADPGELGRLGVNAADVQRAVDLVVTGGAVGEADVDGQRLRVRIAPQLADVESRGPADVLRELTVRSRPAARPVNLSQNPRTGSEPTAMRSDEQSSSSRDANRRGGQTSPVALALLGRPTYVRRPAALRTERGELAAYVYVDLADGTDVQGYVERARREVDAALAGPAIALRPGERIEWTGQYDLMVSGARRLRWIVPLCLLLMLGLLYLQFRNLTESLLVLASVPFALIGSFWTLYLLGYPLSAPVWVGLLSVVGLAMQTGVVMVVYIDESFHRRLRQGLIRSRDDIIEAHAEGTVRRLRPKVMTITTMAAALLPLLWSDGAGAEIMRRVAAPMVGGLATSAFLTLEVIPVLYTLWRVRQLRAAERSGRALAAVVGPAPAWASPPPPSASASESASPSVAAQEATPAERITA